MVSLKSCKLCERQELCTRSIADLAKHLREIGTNFGKDAEQVDEFAEINLDDPARAGRVGKMMVLFHGDVLDKLTELALVMSEWQHVRTHVLQASSTEEIAFYQRYAVEVEEGSFEGRCMIYEQSNWDSIEKGLGDKE